MLVILRPEPGAGDSVRRAARLGLDPIAIPLFRIVPVDWEAPDPKLFDALLLTSANAVRHAGPALDRFRDLPVHAVGTATAEAARGAGLAVGQVGDSGIAGLLARLPGSLRLLHLSGEHRRDSGPTGHRLTVVPVYRSEEIAVDDLGARLSGAVVALHSPRAARTLRVLVERRDRGSIRLAAISTAAAAAAGAGWARVEAAETPCDTALLALAARLCKETDQR